MKPPFTYFGGKTSIADRIAALLPQHEHYVEPFAGSLAVLLAKRPSSMETVNDLNGDLMTFWRVLRDRTGDLERVCMLTPHSRAEQQAAYEPASTELEQARRAWVRLTQSRGRSASADRHTGWRHFADPGSRGVSMPMPARLASSVGRFAPVAGRLIGVSLECLPALDLIEKYGQYPGVLIYADPPYPDSVRARDRNYGHEMLTEAEHRELLEALLTCRAAVVLSGYASPLYDGLLSAWSRLEVTTQTGNGGSDRARTEVLWSNRPLPRQGSLFDDEAV